MTIDTVAAGVFCVLALVATLFQLALVGGAPWGELTQGGRHTGRLPWPRRAVALVSAVLLVGFVVVVSTRAGLMLPGWHPASRTPAWWVVGYCALGTLANAATPSPRERRLWLPVVLAMLVTSVLVASG